MGGAESNGYTAELKFLVNESTGIAIREWVRGRLAADPHGGGAHGDEYRVSTLYLDTEDLDVFHRRGSYGRSKFRVRRYGDEPRVFLERKLRTSSRLAKRRTDIPIDELTALDVTDAADDHIRWFRRRVSIRRLAPVCRVSYLRTARHTQTSDGRMRMTLDYALTASTAVAFALDGVGPTPLLTGHMILELKYRGVMPAVFRELADTFALRQGRSSKYRLAADALGLAQLTTEAGAPRTLHA